jgi:hypothetical protein
MGIFSKNSIIYFTLVVLLSASALLAWDKYGPKKPIDYNISPGVVNSKAEIILEGPKEVKVGQLARFDVAKSSGKTFKWKVLPESTDLEVYDDGRKVVFATGIAGEYTFIVACANDNDVDVKVQKLTVTSDDNVPPPPGPPVPPSPASGLKGKIIEWSNLVSSPNKKAEAGKLATSFSSVKSQIVAGTLDTAELIIEETKNSNRNALGDSLTLWVPFMGQLQKEMRTQAEAGELVTPAQHAQMWGEIADGLGVVSK